MNNDVPTVLELPPLTDEAAWEDPIYFDEVQTPNIPAQLLPGILGQYAVALSNATETPEVLALLIILGVISTASAKRFVVTPKEGWYEPVNIYSMVALPPGNNKSLVLNRCTKPLVEWEKEQAAILEPIIKKEQSKRKTEEKILEAERVRAAKETDRVKQKTLINKIAELENELTQPHVIPHLFANDTTPESLANSVYEQGGCFALLSDEGGIVETLSGLYSKGNANVDILLKGIDGGELRIRRKDKMINLQPYLTVVLAVQPAIIQRMGEKRSFSGNGALERFLYAVPTSKLGFRTHDKPPVPAELQLQYNQRIKALLNKYRLDVNQHNAVNVLSLSIDAQALWLQFQREIEIELRPNEKLHSCQGWGGKICGFALRIAGLLHISGQIEQGNVIDAETMSNALAIAKSLIDHALAAYNLMGLDQPTEDAKEILAYLISNNKPHYTKSDITYAMRHKKCGKSERLNKALKILNERNFISEPMLRPTRKPTTIYYLNPVLLKKSET